MFITEDIRFAGVNDHQVDLFEGQYKVPRGMSYNSYVILDEKTAVMDTVDIRFGEEWLAKVADALAGRKPDYLVIQHMEPDHSANIARFMEVYPGTRIVSSAKAFAMMKNFFGTDYPDRQTVIKEGDTLPLGRHTLHFVAAPMVHWPEVMVTYDDRDKVLFSADGFGKFGALDEEEPWADEARRYYIGIVGKFGAPVQALLKKASALDIAMICPLHGPVLKEDLGFYIGLYDTWSSYRPEEKGVVVAYASVYGNTKQAAMQLVRALNGKGVTAVPYDLARDDMAAAVADAFRYDRLALASITYNGEIYPCMRTYLNTLIEHAYKGRTVAFIENGSWAPLAAKQMRGMLESCKDMTFIDPPVTVKSALSGESMAAISALAEELAK